MKTKSTRTRVAQKEQVARKARSSTSADSTPQGKPDRRETSAVDPKWSRHYRTLIELRDRLLQDTKAKLRDAAEAIETHSMHLADSATDEFDHDLALTLLAREENAISEVNDAITRILEGNYGVCVQSGAKIPAARLRALPWCRYTREVEESLERNGAITRHRIPNAVSIRGPQPEIPGTGKLEPEGTEGEPDELEEPATAKVVDELSTPKTEEIEATPASHQPKTKSNKRQNVGRGAPGA
jgi:RNA polymerase-binding transcription factor DksA